MATELFIDLNSIDLNKTLYDQDAIYDLIPQRHEFMQLDRILYFDPDNGIMVCERVVRADEFWVKGHIPARPLMPGVMMLETAAQMAAVLNCLLGDRDRFTGFAGVDNVKFRGSVTPPATMYFILKLIERRSRRVVSDAQGVLDGKLVFEGRITGMPL